MANAGDKELWRAIVSKAKGMTVKPGKMMKGKGLKAKHGKMMAGQGMTGGTKTGNRFAKVVKQIKKA